MKHTHKKSSNDSNGGGADKQLKEIKREWRQLRKFGNENHLLFAAFIIALAAIVIINASYVIYHSSQQQSSRVTTSQPNSNLVLTSLQTGNSGSVSARISKVTENDKMDYAFTIDPTNTMLIMNISLTNLTTDTQSLFPDSQFYVKSDQGSFSTLHPSMYVTSPLQVSTLKPGQSVQGQLSFSVSKQAARPLLYVDTGWGGYAPIVFDVLH